MDKEQAQNPAQAPPKPEGLVMIAVALALLAVPTLAQIGWGIYCFVRPPAPYGRWLMVAGMSLVYPLYMLCLTILFHLRRHKYKPGDHLQYSTHTSYRVRRVFFFVTEVEGCGSCKDIEYLVHQKTTDSKPILPGTSETHWKIGRAYFGRGFKAKWLDSIVLMGTMVLSLSVCLELGWRAMLVLLSGLGFWMGLIQGLCILVMMAECDD